MVRRTIALLCPLLWLTACPDLQTTPDAGIPDAGPAAPPQIVGLVPSEGPLQGGTQILVTGNHFQEGAKVFLGGVEAPDVTFTSARRLAAKTPAATVVGPVALRVENPDGRSAEVEGAFTYLGEPPPAITQARMVGNAVRQDSSGADPITVTVRADVEVPAITAGQGAGVGIQAQVGYAVFSPTVSLNDLTWTAAQYESDVDGASNGDRARDRYAGQVTLPGLGSGEVTKTYVLAVRFSLNDGPWVIADMDGAANGTVVAQLQRIQLTRNQIDWCRLGSEAIEAPPTVTLTVGQAGPTISAQIHEAGLTDTTNGGPGAGITAQLGYGPSGSDPAGVSWTWIDAAFHAETAGGDNDEYRATLPNPGEGTWTFAYRAQVNGGGWRYCDADGSGAETDFDIAQAGTLTVSAVDIEACALRGPAAYSIVAGQSTPAIAGRVLIPTVTGGAGQGSGVTAEAGFGAPGTAPSTWTWVPAGYAGDQDMGTTDEYSATFTPGALGAFKVAFRFRYQGGAFVYCDLDGSENGFSEAQAATLTVGPACRLDGLTQPGTTTAVTAVQSGGEVEATARILIPGVTNQAGAAPNVVGQVGVGNVMTDAPSSPEWGWQNAAFESDDSTSGEDVYSVVFTPAYTGSRGVSFRFSTDDGQTWTYCDLDGNGTGGYSQAQQAVLQVEQHADIDACVLHHPPALPYMGGWDLFGRVYEAGVTDSGSSGGSLEAEWGFGLKEEDPGLAWTWTAATFNVEVADDDEYQGTMGASVPAGNWAYAFRFRKPGAGNPWCFADLDGHGANSGTGFSAEDGTGGPNLGQATVPWVDEP